MPQITAQDIIRICSNHNPIVNRALNAMMSRLRTQLAQHHHIVFIDWTTNYENPPGPQHRTRITVRIQHANYQPGSPFIYMTIYVKDTGCVYYHLSPNTIPHNPTIPLATMWQINPTAADHHDAHGFTSHVLDAIRTNIAPLPTAKTKTGYFI